MSESRSTNEAMAGHSRCWIWNTIWKCWNASQAHCAAPSLWRSGELRDDGQPVTTGCGSRCVCDMAARAQRGPWLRSLAWVASLAHAQLEASVGQALELGSTDIAAIRHLLMSDQLQHAAAASVEIGALSAYERPLPTMAQYDQLLSGSAIEVQP